MNTLEAILSRRAVKHFDPEEQFEETQIRELIELATHSPTSFNMQNWKFVVVRDPGRREALKQAAWGQAQVTDAALLVILCADLHAFEHGIERMWVNSPEEVQEFLLPKIHGFYHDKPQLQRDEALRSIGIAAQTLMLAARAKGYDSCPMVGFDPDAVAEILQLPEDHLIGMMLPIGTQIEPANPRGGQRPLDEVLLWEGFGES